jgi:plastocyanin
MKTGIFVFLVLGLAAVAPAAANDELARIEATLARLENELSEQKQLLRKVLEVDQRRYEALLELVRSLPGAPAREVAVPAPVPPPAAAPASAGAPTSVTIAGRVSFTQGPQEAYVYLEERGASRGRTAQIRQEGRHFDPPVLVVPVGSRVTFPNADIVFHNVFSRSPAAVFDLGTIKGGQTGPPVTLSRPGHIEIFCNIHPTMRADILVVPGERYTRVQPDGSFTLPAVPSGNRKLVLWGPQLKPSSRMVEGRPGVSVSFSAEPAAPRVHLNKHGRAYGSYDE